MLYIDIDEFKSINDSLGHLIGDELLKAVAGAPQAAASGETDIVARLGGDEFAVDPDRRSATPADVVRIRDTGPRGDPAAL